MFKNVADSQKAVTSFHKICSSFYFKPQRKKPLKWQFGFYVMRERIVRCCGNPSWKSGFYFFRPSFCKKLSLFNFRFFFFPFYFNFHDCKITLRAINFFLFFRKTFSRCCWTSYRLLWYKLFYLSSLRNFPSLLHLKRHSFLRVSYRRLNYTKRSSKWHHSTHISFN